MKWYTALGIETTEKDETILRAEVPPESPWFDGHFPDDPTLPGIAQLEMAADALQLAGKGDFAVRGFRKVRFKRVIRPGERLTVIVKPKKSDEGSYAFRILVGNDLACNGVFFAEDPEE